MNCEHKLHLGRFKILYQYLSNEKKNNIEREKENKREDRVNLSHCHKSHPAAHLWKNQHSNNIICAILVSLFY